MRRRRSRALGGAPKFQVGDCVQRNPKVWKPRGDDTDVYNFLRITAIEPGQDNHGRAKQGYRTRLVKIPDDTKRGTTYLESKLIAWKCPKKR
jgi:hypothetical protein